VSDAVRVDLSGQALELAAPALVARVELPEVAAGVAVIGKGERGKPGPAGPAPEQLGDIGNVDAPPTTPAGMFLGTVGVGAWGPVANPTAGLWPGKIRTSRPNSTDRLVEVWDGAAWIPTHYDSGWRNIASLLPQGLFGTVNVARLRRVGGAVTFILRAEIAGGTIAGQAAADLLTLPAGFVPVEYIIRTQTVIDVVPAHFVNSSVREVLVLARTTGTNIPGTGGVGGTVIWPTDDPIPTSLPGTLATTAP
jgi:hypothetical protein